MAHRDRSPRVSVVIAAYNSAPFLAEAMHSVAEQTFTDYELIVVDDGSTDGTPEIVAATGLPCLYIYQENRGAAAARNTGLRVATGEYVNFLDADDLLLPGHLALLVDYLDQHPAIAVVYADCFYTYEDGSGHPPRRFSHGLRTPPYPSSGNVFEALVINSVFAVHTALARRSCLLEIGGFNEALRSAEDYDLWLRMAERYAFAYLDEPVAKYRIHGSNKVLLQPARRLYSLEKIWSRVVQTEAFHALSPKVRSRFYIRVATQYLVNDQIHQARDALKKAVKHDPMAVMAYLWLGLLLFGSRPLKVLIQARRQVIHLLRRRGLLE